MTIADRDSSEISWRTGDMKIVISGPATAQDRATGSAIADVQRLGKLNGLAYAEDTCGDYLGATLKDIGITGGKIELSFPGDADTLKVRTTYAAPRKLTKAECQLLVKETAAQWSDGIGEGEFQHADELGIDIDLFPSGSKPKIDQIDDGTAAPKPKTNALLQLFQKFKVDEKAAIALVQGGVAIDDQDKEGNTALELACSGVLADLFELLWQRGALAHAANPNRMLSKLAFCSGPAPVLEKSVRIAQRLIEGGFAVDPVDDSGRTPLMMAVNRNNMPLVQFLLSRGANINARIADEHNRHTVLMQAKDVAMVRYLLDHGADPAIRSASGENARENWSKNTHLKNHQEIAALLAQSF